ncbi:MAG: tetratricopeptide repeat protein, partial [Deltaproteobacteria bacterium]|nr:tetratricopeptide repeat protein [Deltaproteobacteria bacterium]
MLSPFLIGLLLLAGAGGPVAEPVCHTGPEGDACAAAVAAVRAERWDEAAICLRICRGADPASAPCRLGWLEGRIHAARGRHEEAEAAFAGLEGCREVPTPLRLLGLFRAARSRGSPRSARSLGRELLRSDPPPGLEVTVRLELAELALELRHPEEASRHLSRVSGKRDAARVLDLRRRIDGARGRTEAAEETALRLLLELPCSPEARTLEPGRAIAQWPPARRMNRARALFRCWDYAAAAALLEGCLREEACAPHHLEAHELLGEIRANRLRDDPAAALGHFEALVKGGRTVEHASYMIGRCLMKLERYDEALEAFQGHLRRYPRGRDAERCRYYLGWLPFDHGRWE